jgi:citrate synthase
MPMILAGLAAYIGSDTESIPAFKGGNIYHGNPEKIDQAIIKTVAAYGVCVGLAASHRKGIKFTPASPDKSYFENIFTMMGNVNPSTGQPDPLILSCFQRAAVVNSDHGMTQSTFVFLATASSLPDPISCLISALAAAYGPLHFGATESAYKVIEKVSRPENVPALIDEVKRGEQRLFGYGHRQKTIDARLPFIKKLVKEMDIASNPLLKVADEIDRIAGNDKYFTKRGLNANADFYGVFFYIAW